MNPIRRPKKPSKRFYIVTQKHRYRLKGGVIGAKLRKAAMQILK